MADFTLLLEAEKRGILPADKVDLLAEARKRGLVPGGTAEPMLGVSLGETTVFPDAGAGLPRGVLPMLGSLGAGGLALALTKNPTAAYMANVAGAGAGSAAEDLLLGEPTDEEMAKRAVGSMIGAGIAPGVGAGAERLAMPGAGRIAQEARAALDFARRNNLPIDVGEVNPSWITSLFSGDIFAAGRFKTKQYAKTANDYLIGMRSKILSSLTGAEETATIPIAAVPGRVKPTLKLKTKEAYEEPLRVVQEQFGDVDAVVRLENMRRTAGQMLGDVRIQNAKKAKWATDSPKEWLEDFLKTTKKGGGAKFSDIHQVQSKINKIFYGASQEGGAPLLASLADDLVRWDAVVGQKLNEAYTLARASAKNEFLFDSVYSVLRGATKVDKESGAEMLNGILLKSKLQTPVKGLKGLTPEKNILEKLGPEEGKKVLDDLYAIADYATYTRGLRAKEGMKLIDPTTLISGGAGPAAGSLLGVAGPVAGIAIPQGSSLSFTVMLTGPGKKGFLRNWLLKEGHPALKMGTRLGVQMGGEQMK